MIHPHVGSKYSDIQTIALLPPLEANEKFAHFGGG